MRPALPLCLSCLLALCGCAGTQVGPTAAPTAQNAQAPASATQAQSQAQAEAMLEDCARTLMELRAATPQRMLDASLEDARAVIVLPGVYQAGFFYSLHGGGGALLARRPDGGWGSPLFVSLGGAGYGPQVGLEKSRLVLVLREEEMLERILDSGLHFEASAGFDILGVREQTSRGSLTERRPVEAYSDGVGLMAGVALRGGVLRVNQGLSAAYHGEADMSRILRGSGAPGLGVFRLWSALPLPAPGPELIVTRTGRP